MRMRRTKRRSKKAGVSRKRSTRRGSRRSMGTLTQSGLLEALTTIGGAVASRYIVNQLAKSNMGGTFLQKPGNKALVQVGLGVVTPLLSKNPIVSNLSKGMVVSGGFEFFKTLAPAVLGATDEDSEVIVVSGMDEIGAMDMLGADEISEINGVDEISEINGISDFDYNY
jgi:hypothetical protein